MKTSRFLLLTFLILGLSAHSQKIYLRGGFGIAVSTAASYTYSLNNAGNSSSTFNVNKGGIGTGLPFVVAAGYKLNEHFGLELGLDYFYGFSLTSSTTGQASTNDTKWRGQMLSIVPAFVMSIPLEKFSPYARLGLKLGVMNSVVYQEHLVISFETKATDEDIQTKNKEYGGVAIGAQAAMGTDFILSGKISLFGEIQLDGISYSPKHGKYTEYTINGTDKLGSMTVNQKEWNYIDDVDYSKTIPSDQPDEQMKVNHHFGNVGLVLGVKVNL